MIKIKTALHPWNPDIEVLLVEVVNGKHTGYVSRMELVKLDEGAFVNEPTFTLSRENAQELVDSLWACGIRPTEGVGSAGALAATQKHLDDMRKLVFESKR